MKTTSADVTDLRIPLLPPEKPIEFETNTDYEIDEIDRRLCCDNNVSKEGSIQCLPFLMSRFGIDKDMIMKMEKIDRNLGDNLIISEKRYMDSQAQETRNERINSDCGLNNEGLNSENNEFSRYNTFHLFLISFISHNLNVDDYESKL